MGHNMRMSLTEYVNTTLTIRIVPLTLSPLWVIVLVRLRTFTFWMCESFILTVSSGNWQFFYNFRSSPSTIWQQHLTSVFSSHLKSKVGNILTKTVTLRINLNIDGSPTDSEEHTHPSHSQTSRVLTSSLCLKVDTHHVPLRQPNDLDGTLNEDTTDKILQSALTIITVIVPLTLSPLWLLLLVRLTLT
jgi:hypothetical protein